MFGGMHWLHPAQTLGKVQIFPECDETEEIQQGAGRNLVSGQKIELQPAGTLLEFSLLLTFFDSFSFLSQDLDGHQFLSVLDLEDHALHQDLPPCLGPEAPDVPSLCPSSPTAAQLHVLATSVISSAAADPQPVVTVPEDILKRTNHTGLYTPNEGLMQLWVPPK